MLFLTALEFCNVGSNGSTQYIEVISALEARNDATIRGAIRPLFYRGGEGDKIFVFQCKLAQRIAPVRVKAVGDDDEVRRESDAHSFKSSIKHSSLLSCRRSRLDRNI